MKTLSECSILIVEDMETNVDILVEALGESYDVAVAMDGLSALEMVEESPPDLVLLDIQMPGMDGYEVCRRLKANPETAEIPIVFLTAMSKAEDKRKAFTMGAADYITKPFELLEVEARTKTHLTLTLLQEELRSYRK
jgi:CheY-like chemotaxis protein